MTDLSCCDFDDFVKAVADETRQRILILLQSGELSVSELAEHFTTTQPTISHHLAVLSRAQLVSARQVGRQVYYHVNPACGLAGCLEILRRFNIP